MRGCGIELRHTGDRPDWPLCEPERAVICDHPQNAGTCALWRPHETVQGQLTILQLWRVRSRSRRVKRRCAAGFRSSGFRQPMRGVRDGVFAGLGGGDGGLAIPIASMILVQSFVLAERGRPLLMRALISRFARPGTTIDLLPSDASAAATTPRGDGISLVPCRAWHPWVMSGCRANPDRRFCALVVVTFRCVGVVVRRPARAGSCRWCGRRCRTLAAPRPR